MKKILIIMLLFATSKNVLADCITRDFSVWPNNSSINANSIFIITGYETNQDLIKGLNLTFPIYLLCKKKKINLIVKEICIGNKMTQAFLYPSTPLEIGSEYTMIIDSIKTAVIEKRKIVGYKKDRKEIKIYKVEKPIDNQSPTFSEYPKQKTKHYDYYGCGPAIYVDFDANFNSNKEVLVKTNLKDLQTGISKTYYIEIEYNNIIVGHGMCGGSFSFRDGTKYEVFFSLMDACGNYENRKEPKLFFTSPVYKKQH
jgi:hypothetical protein